jgi:hypothetical protein
MPTVAGRFLSPTPRPTPASMQHTPGSASRRSTSAAARQRPVTPRGDGSRSSSVLDSPVVSQQKLLEARKGRPRSGLTLSRTTKNNSDGHATLQHTAAATARNGSPVARAKDDWMRTELKRLEKINRERLQAHVEGLRGLRGSVLPLAPDNSSTPTPSSSDEPTISYSIRHLVAPQRVEQLPKSAGQQQHHADVDPPAVASHSSVSPPRPLPAAVAAHMHHDATPQQSSTCPKGPAAITPTLGTPQFRIKWTPIKSSPGTLSLVSLEAGAPPVLSKSGARQLHVGSSRLQLHTPQHGAETLPTPRVLPLPPRPSKAVALVIDDVSPDSQLAEDSPRSRPPPESLERYGEGDSIGSAVLLPDSSAHRCEEPNATAHVQEPCAVVAAPAFADPRGELDEHSRAPGVAGPKFCWECGSRHPHTVVVKFCVVCGAKVAVQ